MDFIWLFEWLDASFIADAAKAYGGVYVVVQTAHLMGLAMLGGMVIVADLRLLGVLMTGFPISTVVRNAQRGFNVAIVVLVLSGIFLAGAVSMKLYYNEMFLAKMIGLGVGILFVYLIRAPLLAREADELSPWVCRLMGAASLVLWFTVAASGRWIGFS